MSVTFSSLILFLVLKMGNIPSSSGGNKNTTVAVVTGFLALSSAGFAIVAWMFYDRINRATNLDNLKDSFQNIEQLNSAIDSMRKEIEELKALKSVRRQTSGEFDDNSSRKSSKVVRFKNKLSVISTSDETEYQSAWYVIIKPLIISINQLFHIVYFCSRSGNDSSDEFFDFSENDLEELEDDTK